MGHLGAHRSRTTVRCTIRNLKLHFEGVPITHPTSNPGDRIAAPLNVGTGSSLPQERELSRPYEPIGSQCAITVKPS